VGSVRKGTRKRERERELEKEKEGERVRELHRKRERERKSKCGGGGEIDFFVERYFGVSQWKLLPFAFVAYWAYLLYCVNFTPATTVA
jgi:hypothetical protein